MVFACLIIATISFSIGAIVSGMNRWFVPIISISVKNQTGIELTNLSLKCESDGIITNILIKQMDLAPNAIQNFEWVTYGSGISCEVISETGGLSFAEFLNSDIINENNFEIPLRK